jgi:pimeloyl-ACP methyl ester carboxylesterase
VVALWSATSGPTNAPLMLLIHGTMDRSTGMLKLSRQLDHRCQVARYDRRGYGRSVDENGLHPGPFDMASQVQDALGLINGRPVVVVGHSYGGNVALTLAAQRPDLVRGVVVYETPLSWEPFWPGTTGAAAAMQHAQDPAAAAEAFMRRLVGDGVWDGLPERTRQIRRREGVPMLGELSDLRRNRPWSAVDVRCPVVIGYGSKGRPHHQHGMKFLHEQLPGSQLRELAGCRHDAPLSQPLLFAEQLVHPLLNELEINDRGD